MATYVIGDIHGRADLLSVLLTRIEPQPSDHVVFLGDYIDRGHESRSVVETLLAYRKSVDATVTFLMGNHESCLLQTLQDHRRHSWILGMQGLSTIRSYSEEAARQIESAISELGPTMITEKPELPYEKFFSMMPADHIHFFQELNLYVKDEGVVCVHAGVSPDCQDLANENQQVLLWGQKGWWFEYRGSDTIVYGHWGNAACNKKVARPFIHGTTIGIDCVASGQLLAIRLPDRSYWTVTS